MRSYAKFMFILAPICLVLTSCVGNNKPEIYIDGDTYKFGQVKAGQNIVFTFFISNPGKADLVIKDVYISCDCLEVRRYDKVIEAGTRGQVYGFLKTSGLDGEILRAMKLKTNIPGMEPVLTIKGEVYTPGKSPEL